MLPTMPEIPRTARPGDIFILLVPIGDDLARLERENRAWHTRYGGQLVEPIHITVERFTPEDGLFAQDCIAIIKENLRGVQTFQLFTDALIQFFAPYWQSRVLRWRVAETPLWNDFRDLLENVLNEIRCPSHFTRRRHATCTILKLDDEIDPALLPPEISMPLFGVHELWISILRENGQFEVLEVIKIRD